MHAPLAANARAAQGLPPASIRRWIGHPRFQIGQPRRAGEAMAALSSALSSANEWAADNKALAASGAAAGLLGALYLWRRRADKPSSFELTGGAVDARKVKDTVRAGSPCPVKAASGPGALPQQPPPPPRVSSGGCRLSGAHAAVGRLLRRGPAAHPTAHSPPQVAEYYGEFNTLERGKGAVLKESQKVRGGGWAPPTDCARGRSRLVAVACRACCRPHAGLPGA